MYSTPQDVRDRIQTLPSRVTDDMISRFIEEADAIIEAHLSALYFDEIPFSDPVPRIIKYLSAEIATCKLAFSLYTSQQPNMDAYQMARYEEAMQLLNKVANGEMPIPELPQESAYGSTNSDPPIFTRGVPPW
jgi:phage gp36-like protein